MIEKYTMPVIHMNGSGEDSLRRQYNKLFCAISDAKTKLYYGIDFHERDYYPLGEEAWQKALAERTEIIESLAKVYEYARSHMYELDYGKEPLPEGWRESC